MDGPLLLELLVMIGVHRLKSFVNVLLICLIIGLLLDCSGQSRTLRGSVLLNHDQNDLWMGQEDVSELHSSPWNLSWDTGPLLGIFSEELPDTQNHLLMRGEDLLHQGPLECCAKDLESMLSEGNLFEAKLDNTTKETLDIQVHEEYAKVVWPEAFCMEMEKVLKDVDLVLE